MERPGTSSGGRHFDGISNVSIQGPQIQETYSITIQREMAKDDLMRIKNYNTNFVNNQALLRADEGNIDKLMTILQNNEDVLYCRGSDGYTLLHHACNKGHDDIVQKLLSYGGLVNEKNNSGETPLHLAVYANRVSTTRILLSHPELDLSSVNNDNETALFYAVRRNNLELIELLLRWGIDHSVMDRYGELAIDHCVDDTASAMFTQFHERKEAEVGDQTIGDSANAYAINNITSSSSSSSSSSNNVNSGCNVSNVSRSTDAESLKSESSVKGTNALYYPKTNNSSKVDVSALVFQFAARSAGNNNNSSKSNNNNSYSELQSHMGFEPCATSTLLSRLPAGSAAALLRHKSSSNSNMTADSVL